MEKYTPEQFNKVAHTLGINLEYAIRSKFKKDKVLPNEFYRNHFCVSSTEGYIEPEWLAELVPFINEWTQYFNHYFCINDKGIELFRNQFKEEITDTYKPRKK